MTYVPLAIRSEYDFHGGMCRVQELIERAQALKLEAVGIADHNSTFGWAPFAAAAKQAGIQPIFGVRVTLVTKPGSDTETTSELVLQATSQQGLRNLLRLVSQAHLEDETVRQAITFEDLEQSSEGILALDGGANGAIQQALRQGEVREARSLASKLQQLFGERGFFIQIERHGMPEELRIEALLMRLARRSGIPLVAAGNTCYLNREDAEAYEILRCMGSQRTLQQLDESDGMRSRHHLRSPSEMQRLYQDVPAALENCRWIAQQCSVDIYEALRGTFQFKQSATATDSLQVLKGKCEEGACERYETTSYQDVPDAARSRIAHELALIEEKELASCFLIAQDVVRYAKEEGIPVGPGRGSLSGSLVAWVLEMTEVDPLRFGLQFEGSFASVNRALPALEIEVGHRWRDQLLREVKLRAGRSGVACLSSLSRLQGRSLLHNVGKVLGIATSTLATVERLSRDRNVHVIRTQFSDVPRTQSNNIFRTQSSGQGLSKSAQLRRLFQDDPQARRLLEVCSRLEGLPYHVSLCAGGLLLFPGEAMQRVALERSSQGLRAQATEATAELHGWTRIVVHGSRQLSAQYDAERIVIQTDAAFDGDEVPLDDEATWRLIAHGDVSCIAGLETPAAQNIVRAMQPARLTDLVACLTLASPLAQASGMTERYLSAPTSGRVPEDLQDILGETAGWILYEEQVMQIAQRIGGFDCQEAWDFCEAIQADALQRLQQMRPRFLSGALEQGITLRYAERVLDTVMAARVGGQRRGQATAQALVAYRTAWLLTNHPAATLVGLLNNSVGQGAKQQRILAMAVEQGCRIVKVDVNRSEEGYLIEDGAIRLAMSHVPSVGEATAAALVAERRRGGDFKSVQDVLMRVPSLHRLQVDAMVDAGAFEKLCDSSLAVKSREDVAAVRVASKRPTVFSHGRS